LALSKLEENKSVTTQEKFHGNWWCKWNTVTEKVARQL
jgi:hypothetical protein